MKPRIAVSIAHEDPHPARTLFLGKVLQYVEQEMLRAVHLAGGRPYLLPDLGEEGETQALLEGFDGLLLTGGADLAPEAYGETALRPEWAGDRRRDLYELSLLQAAHARGMPILGVCRGFHLLNVGFGGSLYQDLETQREGSLRHRDPELYDQLEHGIELVTGTRFAGVYPDGLDRVNSVHHQGLRDLGGELEVAARAEDGLVEAVEHRGTGFCIGVQWHPEWMHKASEGRVDPLFRAFVGAAGQSSAH